MNRQDFRTVEWPTVLLALACQSTWLLLAFAGDGVPAALWIVVMALLTTLYWSLVHEAVHLHPTRTPWINQALVWLPIGWVYSYGRFRETHLDHHTTGALTDPFDDPESWYLSQHDWAQDGQLTKALLTFNNTLLGRLTLGPLIVLWRMIIGDGRLILRGGETGRRVARDWLMHLPGVVLLASALAIASPVPVWQFAAACYGGISILLIRTFLEHQAAEDAGERTVIIEDRGLLAFLFLFNNLHVVHHTRPGLAWYLLPGFYRRHREQFIRRNRGYVYASYWQIFARHFLKAKEPVPHPTRIA